jgi:membrane-associated phospholipid phosphatase
VALLAACVAATAALGVQVAGRTQPVWLDVAVDARLRAAFGRFGSLLTGLASLGTLLPTTLMTVALVLACLAARRWSGALLAAVAEPAASGLTEFVLKPAVDRTSHHWLSFPSGHATAMFALAGVCVILLGNPPRRRLPGAVRLVLALAALLLAVAVAAAMVVLGEHYFTDAVAGAATGTGMALACALVLDWLATARGGQYRRRPRKVPPADPPVPCS